MEKKQYGLGHTRLTVPGRPDLTNKTAVVMVGDKTLEEVIDGIVKGTAKREPVKSISAMTDAQIESLGCGDVVLKEDSTGQHAYIVSFRSKTGICLTYTDCENVETVSYDKTDSGWVYNSTDVTHIASEQGVQ